MKSRHHAIRDLLLASEDGLTVNEIADHFGATPKTICKTLKTVCGAYIDRWTGPTRGQYTAVYVCAEVPEDAPHPTKTIGL
jgi:predicted DNA-binding transcriptional regulator YafY